MAGLVADYGSDSDSSSSDSDSSAVNINKGESDGTEKRKSDLPAPDFKTGKSEGRSVFLNPFVEADNAKIAILEKHVKMISTDVKTVNGRKICWNYKKNKCRFGHNCKYAHDSDVQMDSTRPLKHDLNATNDIYGSKKRLRSGVHDSNEPCGKINVMNRHK